MDVRRITDIWEGVLSGAEGRVSIKFVSLCRETRTTVPSTSPLGPILPPHDGISPFQIWSLPRLPTLYSYSTLFYHIRVYTLSEVLFIHLVFIFYTLLIFIIGSNESENIKRHKLTRGVSKIQTGKSYVIIKVEKKKFFSPLIGQ